MCTALMGESGEGGFESRNVTRQVAALNFAHEYEIVA